MCENALNHPGHDPDHPGRNRHHPDSLGHIGWGDHFLIKIMATLLLMLTSTLIVLLITVCLSNTFNSTSGTT